MRLDNDSKLLAALKRAGNVVLPMYFGEGLAGAKPEDLPAAFAASTVGAELKGAASEPVTAEGTRAVVPIPVFAEASMGVGYVNLEHDLDGVVRREAPVQRYGSARLPSYSVQLALAALGLKPADAVLVPGKELRLGKVSVPVDEDNRATP